MDAAGQPSGDVVRVPARLLGNLHVPHLAIVLGGADGLGPLLGAHRAAVINTSQTEPADRSADFAVPIRGALAVRRLVRSGDALHIAGEGGADSWRPASPTEALAIRPIGRIIWLGHPVSSTV